MNSHVPLLRAALTVAPTFDDVVFCCYGRDDFDLDVRLLAQIESSPQQNA